MCISKTEEISPSKNTDGIRKKMKINDEILCIRKTNY